MRTFALATFAAAAYASVAAAEEPAASPELKVLDQWIGTWEEESTNKPTPWLPEVQTKTVVTKREWALRHRFVRAEGTWEPDQTECLHLITFDAIAKKYRSWYFDSANTMPRGAVTGEWDAEKKTMTWRGVDEGGNKTEGEHKIVDNDHHEWHFAIRGPGGETLLDVSGKSVRRKE
jgi:hypothetical protein